MATFNTGALNVATSHNFVSYYDAHEPDIQDRLVQRYANSMIGFLDFVNAKKPTDALEFSRFEKDRTMPKIKATNGGAGAAGAQVSFTLHADVQVDIPSAAPYDTSATPDEKATTPRVGDLIMIKPGTGSVSYGSYIKCIVDSVTNYASFTATPLNSSDAIPSIASADEIVIYGNAHGEGSGYNSPMSNTATKYTEKLQIIKDRVRVTGSEGLTKKWFTDDSGEKKFAVQGEGDAYARFVNFVDLTLLVGDELANTANIANAYQTAGTPLALTKGLLTQINGAGNILNYAAVSGLTLDDIRDYNVDIDAQDAQKTNIMNAGIVLDQQLDEELGDRLKAGSISYGNFSMDSDKAVNLSFQKFRVGAYTYDKRCMESFNNIQTLGADGYGFKHEAFTVPSGTSMVAGGKERGSRVASLRKRFLANDGKSREMLVDYFNARTMSKEGEDYEEVRYLSHVALEAQALNQFGYIKRA
jgi:hypothetical protein